MMTGFGSLRYAAAVAIRCCFFVGCILIAPANLRAERPPDVIGPLHEVGWGGGESMTFAIKLAGIEGGRGAISVGMPRNNKGRRSLKMRGLSESSPFVSAFRRIREEDVVHLDLTGLLPLEWKSDRILDEKRRELLTMYGPPITQEVRQNGRTSRQQRNIAPPVLEGLSALYILRSINLVPGLRLKTRVLGGLNLYRVEVVVRGTERIVVQEHPRATVRLDGVARQIEDDGRDVVGEPARKFSLWLGQDRARIPYRVKGDTKLGSAEAVLTSYHPPKTRLRIRVHGLVGR